jgi:hypothetical protein
MYNLCQKEVNMMFFKISVLLDFVMKSIFLSKEIS